MSEELWKEFWFSDFKNQAVAVVQISTDRGGEKTSVHMNLKPQGATVANISTEKWRFLNLLEVEQN